jgi:inner membrane protein involved in colicin E2 resistance
VVSNRFAYVEAALAQLVYLVGFSLAHFWAGLTGLTVTLLAIVTLAAVMQLTGRLKWSEVLARPTTRGVAPAGAGPTAELPSS